MDPGAKAVQDHLFNVIMDIITRYDIDGIHWDDYFYPYPVRGLNFPDDDTYNAYRAGGGRLGRADWRRNNVNGLVTRVYSGIKSRKKNVKFSISPFGIYRPGHPEGMPRPIRGLDQYSALFADPKLWMKEGWVDFIAPQLYWAIAPPGQSYPVLLNWWVNNNPRDRHIYAGNALYKLAGSTNWPVSEIVNQVGISRSLHSRFSQGNVHYSAKYFRDNTKSCRDTFRSQVYSNTVRIPPMPWLQRGDVPVPKNVQIKDATITWDSAPEDEVHQWTVYRRDGPAWVLVTILTADTTSISLGQGVYAIRAASRVSVESEPAVIVIPGAGLAG